MKLIELILNYKYLYEATDNLLTMTKFAVSKSEVAEVTADIKHNVEKRRKQLNELRDLSNQLFSALANNNITVAGEELSLATALEQLGGFSSIYGKEPYCPRPVGVGDIFAPVGCCPPFPSYSTITGLSHPEMKFLEGFSKEYMSSCNIEDEDFEVLVDPYNVHKDGDFTKLVAYEKELKSAFIQAISSIEV